MRQHALSCASSRPWWLNTCEKWFHYYSKKSFFDKYQLKQMLLKKLPVIVFIATSFHRHFDKHATVTVLRSSTQSLSQLVYDFKTSFQNSFSHCNKMTERFGIQFQIAYRSSYHKPETAIYGTWVLFFKTFIIWISQWKAALVALQNIGF